MKNLTHDEKSKIIRERVRDIKREIKKRKLNKKDYDFTKSTRDKLQRKIMRSSQQDLAEIGFNALIDEACKFKPKNKEKNENN